MISKAAIRTILKIAVKDPAPWQDENYKTKPPKPATPIRPEDFVNMTDEEKNKVFQNIRGAISQYFQQVGLPNNKAKQYYDQIIKYLLGEETAQPQIEKVMPPPPSESDIIKMERAYKRRRRPPAPRGPGGKMPRPRAATDWYSTCLKSLKET